MAHGHRPVFRKEQKRRRFAHDIAPADHNAFLPGNLNIAALQQFDDTCGRTGNKTPLPGTERPCAHGMKTVHVLFHIDRPDHLIFINMRRQGQLYQNTVYRLIFV